MNGPASQPSDILAMPLQPGAEAPDIKLPTHDRQWISFTDYRGEKPVVVIFFPLAFSGVCTDEICQIGSDLADYQALDAQVLAVSVDSPYVLDRFRRECGAEFPFLSDFNREATRAFGVLRPEPISTGLLETSDRSAFVIDRDGRIAWSWLSKNPTIIPPFDEIKEVLGGMRGK